MLILLYVFISKDVMCELMNYIFFDRQHNADIRQQISSLSTQSGKQDGSPMKQNITSGKVSM